MQCCLRAQSHNKRQENLSLRLIRFAVCALVRRERIERMHVVLQDAREVRRTSLCRLGATYHCDSRRILTSPSALAGPIHATSSSGFREYVKTRRQPLPVPAQNPLRKRYRTASIDLQKVERSGARLGRNQRVRHLRRGVELHAARSGWLSCGEDNRNGARLARETSGRPTRDDGSERIALSPVLLRGYTSSAWRRRRARAGNRR